MQAIKTFHTGVSEDFLLKEEQFKDVRDRLLKSASDFYGQLGAMLGKESDTASRRELGQANYEAAELTEKVGQKEAALAAHLRVLAYREGAGGRAGGRRGDQGRRGPQPDGRGESTVLYGSDGSRAGGVSPGRGTAG